MDESDYSSFREGLVPGDEARRLVLGACEPIGHETLPLSAARNRLLAKDLSALRTQPPFDASAMDGYAVRQSDIATLPAPLKIVGESAAGHPYIGSVGEGCAVRIFTGAIVPEGADTIVIQENTEATGDAVNVLTPSPKGKFIRPAGMDFREGETLLKTGHRLSASNLSLAASMNHAQVSVFKKPKVAVLATGDELVPPGSPLGDGQIIASNSYGLAAMVEASGGEVLDLGIAKDTLDALTEKAEAAIADDANIVVTMGGASVGDHDLVKPAFEALGFRFILAKIAMRPGKPLLFAIRESDGKRVILLGLAGNPVSSLVAASVFLKPAIQILGGSEPEAIKPIDARLGSALPANDEREEYMRAVSKTAPDGSLEIFPFEKQDSSMLANLVRANCLLIRPKLAPPASIGDPCKIVEL